MLTQNESTLFQSNLSINFQGFLMDFSTARVMGIVNLTPDSFYDGGNLKTDKDLLSQAEKMLLEGADLLDLGAFSSRPGAAFISEEEELKRLLPAIEAIKNEFPKAILSVDTYRKNTAEAAFEKGVNMINDISAGNYDEELLAYVAEQKIPYLLMHMKGSPKTMQDQAVYEDVLTEVFGFLQERILQLRALGCKDILVDPGFGFAKNLDHNYRLLKNLNYFKNLNCPILVGISRKKMIQKLIEGNAEMALNGTTAAHTIALLNGANLLRVHDVKAAKEALTIVAYMQKQ